MSKAKKQQRPETLFDKFIEHIEAEDMSMFSHGSGFPSLQPNQNKNQNGAAPSGCVISYEAWRVLVYASRYFSAKDPNCHQLVSLPTTMALGEGMNVQSAAATPEAKAAAQEVLDRFVGVKPNGMDASGQQVKSRMLVEDGERYDAMYTIGLKGKETALRHLNPLEIDRFISDPDDQSVVWFYQRKTSRGDEDIVRWYRERSFRNAKAQKAKNADGEEVWEFPDLKVIQRDPKTDAVLRGPNGKPIEGAFQSDPGVEIVEDVSVNRVFINSTGQRGIPALAASLGWAHELRKFNEGRSSIARSRAEFAYNTKVKGGEAVVKAQAAARRSATNTTNAQDSNPPAAFGSDWFENEAITRTPIDQKTAAQDARIDSANMLRLASIGMGVMPPWMGNDNSFRLATSKSIETPMMKMFQVYQQVLKDSFGIIFDQVLINAGFGEEDRKIDLNFPPIVTKSRKESFDMMDTFLDRYPEFRANENIQEFQLTLIGIDHPDRIVTSVGLVQESGEGQDGEENEGEGEGESGSNGVEAVAMAEGKGAALISMQRSARDLAAQFADGVFDQCESDDETSKKHCGTCADRVGCKFKAQFGGRDSSHMCGAWELGTGGNGGHRAPEDIAETG